MFPLLCGFPMEKREKRRLKDTRFGGNPSKWLGCPCNQTTITYAYTSVEYGRARRLRLHTDIWYLYFVTILIGLLDCGPLHSRHTVEYYASHTIVIHNNNIWYLVSASTDNGASSFFILRSLIFTFFFLSFSWNLTTLSSHYNVRISLWRAIARNNDVLLRRNEAANVKNNNIVYKRHVIFATPSPTPHRP